MKRRTLLKGVGAVGLLGLGAGTASATDGVIEEPEPCHFECCQTCYVALCPGGCECERFCSG